MSIYYLRSILGKYISKVNHGSWPVKSYFPGVWPLARESLVVENKHSRRVLMEQGRQSSRPKYELYPTSTIIFWLLV
jgi:hypothetical protein